MWCTVTVNCPCFVFIVFNIMVNGYLVVHFVFLIGICVALSIIFSTNSIATVMLVCTPNVTDYPANLTVKAKDYPPWFMKTISVTGPLFVILFLIGFICAMFCFVNNLRLIAKDPAMMASPVSVNKIQL